MTQASQQAQEISPLFHHVKGLMYMEKGDRYGNLVTGEKLRQKLLLYSSNEEKELLRFAYLIYCCKETNLMQIVVLFLYM